MLEPARLTWIDWLNHRCLLELAGTAPPAKVDANHHVKGFWPRRAETASGIPGAGYPTDLGMFCAYTY